MGHSNAFIPEEKSHDGWEGGAILAGHFFL
jgi:hypothetical protein